MPEEKKIKLERQEYQKTYRKNNANKIREYQRQYRAKQKEMYFRQLFPNYHMPGTALGVNNI